jgi:hypothetical protein
VRIFDIPIESKKEAFLALPNLFEDFIDIEGYKFHIQKIDTNKYLGIAYDDEFIKNEIKNSGLSLRKINGIYFAQNEFIKFYEEQEENVDNEVFSIHDAQFVYENNILVQLPKSFHIDNTKAIDLKMLSLSKEYVVLDNFSKFISNKNAYLLSIFAIIFSILLLIKALYIHNIGNKVEQNIDTIKQESQMPSTLFQTKSILQSLEKTENNYKKLRDIFEFGINFKKAFPGLLQEVEYIGKTITFTYLGVNANSVEQYFAKLENKKRYIKNNESLKVVITHE